MNLFERLKKERIYFDGGMGTLLNECGIRPGEKSEAWSISHPDVLVDIHRQYLEAGADVITCNTFGVNLLAYDEEQAEKLICAAIRNVKKAMEGYDNRYIAYDIGPTGKLIKPMGTMEFETAVAAYAGCVRIAEREGADLVIIETMNDSMETKAAVLAVKENSSLPVIVSNAYDERQKLMTGADPEAMVAMLEGLRVDAIGMNCSFGPDKMIPVVQRIARVSSLPIIVMPNAGLPKVVDGKTCFDITPDWFAEIMCEIAADGGCILGGCCGTTPEHIRKMKEATLKVPYTYPEKKSITLISSYSHALEIGKDHLLIGERINPTGKKKLKEALIGKDYAYVLKEAIRQEEKGVHILDVNAGLPQIDEPQVLKDLIEELQAVTNLPLQIDTSDPKALEQAARIYNGKPLVNSVSGTKESMDAVFPVVQKYGGCVIALTIGEEGIPQTAEERCEIARTIVEEALKYGIEAKEIIVDPLALTVSSDDNSANVTLDSIRMLKEQLGLYTSLGVSNISFGLPQRNIINSFFYAMAMYAGLDLAIMNPFSEEMMNAYYSFNALKGRDRGCMNYISYASGIENAPKEQAKADMTLSYAIEKGFLEEAAKLAEDLLKEKDPFDIINEQLVPALNKCGSMFEEKKLFLPQLIMAADAAGSAFEVLKQKMPGSADESKAIVLATVKGDIHDIGKNIVRALLESYGFYVKDLGKDVAPETIVEASRGCRLVGLSALMTTTVPAMEETIELLKKENPDAKVIVGGAVLNQEYADEIGADAYGKEAMDTVRYAQEIIG